MSGFRSLLRRVATMGVAITLACGEAPSPTELAEAPALSAVPGQQALVLELNSPNAKTLTKTRTIGSDGGKLTIGGVQLDIPAGALAGDTEITMTVPAGRYAQAILQPHGLQFEGTATLSFSGVDASSAVNGVYFAADDDGADGVVEVAETLGLRVRGNNVSMEIEHFSGYCLSTGTCECY